MARNLLDDPEVQAYYLGYLRAGLGRHEAAKRIGCTNAVARRFIATNPDFAEEVADAEGEPVDELIITAFEVARRGDPVMLKFMLERLDPERFGPKATVRHEHVFAIENADELAALAERLLRRQGELARGDVINIPAPTAVAVFDPEDVSE